MENIKKMTKVVALLAILVAVYGQNGLFAGNGPSSENKKVVDNGIVSDGTSIVVKDHDKNDFYTVNVPKDFDSCNSDDKDEVQEVDSGFTVMGYDPEFDRGDDDDDDDEIAEVQINSNTIDKLREKFKQEAEEEAKKKRNSESFNNGVTVTGYNSEFDHDDEDDDCERVVQPLN